MKRGGNLRRDTEAAREFQQRRAPLRRTGFGQRGDRLHVSKHETSAPYREPWQENPKPGPCRISGWSVAEKGEEWCRNCGVSGVRLHLHHAVPRSLCPAGRADLRNGIALCPACHSAFHAGQPLPREMFTEEEWEFISTLIGPGWLARRYPRDLLRRELEDAA